MFGLTEPIDISGKPADIVHRNNIVPNYKPKLKKLKPEVRHGNNIYSKNSLWIISSTFACGLTQSD